MLKSGLLSALITLISCDHRPTANPQPLLDCQMIATTMMTQECSMLEETCSVEGVAEFPAKTFTCGHGKLNYQKFLCANFPGAMNSHTLEGIVCTTKAKSEIPQVQTNMTP